MTGVMSLCEDNDPNNRITLMNDSPNNPASPLTQAWLRDWRCLCEDGCCCRPCVWPCARLQGHQGYPGYPGYHKNAYYVSNNQFMMAR